MILFVDIETTGLPDKRLPVEHIDQPEIVELGMVLAENDGTYRQEINILLAPRGDIPAQATEVHGIATEAAHEVGAAPAGVFRLFDKWRRAADLVVAHNADFERDTLCGAMLRYGWGWGIVQKLGTLVTPGTPPWHCTMRAATPICQLPPRNRARRGPDDHKWPSLDEALGIILGEPRRQGVHRALDDAHACRRLYFAMREREAAA